MKIIENKNMNILYIIGNGFDLNIGMKTSYNDFYNYYQQLESTNPNVNKLKKFISQDFQNWSDLELTLGKYTEKIENEKEFHEIFEDIGDNLAEYLHKQESQYDFDGFEISKIINDLAEPENYLYESDYNKVRAFKEKKRNLIFNVYDINVISFNYTKSFERILRCDNKGTFFGNDEDRVEYSLNIEHIHGYVNDRMIMGVNDVSQIANSTFHDKQEIIESFIKKECNRICKHTVVEKFEEMIEVADIICVFGSSLGETDKMWWNKIGNQLKRDIRIIVFYKSYDVIPRRRYKIGPIERQIKKTIMADLNMTEEEKNDAESKIHISVNSDMFALRKWMS